MMLRRLALATALPLLATTADAMVREGNCALVVAARSSLAEVQAFELQNPQLTITEVYESSNGWYAISIGQVASEAAEGRLAALKRGGTVPKDSYCSTGKSYVREVSIAPGIGEGAPLPANTNLAAPFDARPIDVEEKRFLQSAL